MTSQPPFSDNQPDGLRLLGLAAGRMDPDPTQLAALCARITDWPQVIAAAQRHRVLPLLSTLLLQQPSDLPVPDSHRQALSARTIRQSQQSLALAAEVLCLEKALQNAGINVLFCKGISLSLHLYGDIARRSPGDIDLLVAPAQFASALSLLLARGYLIDDPRLRPDSRDLHRIPVRDIGLRHPNGYTVELHQRLTQDPTLFPFSFETLWDQRQMIAGLPVALPTLGPVHLPLYLLIHGAEHGWTRLRWLADLLPFFDAPEQARAVWAEATRLDLGHALTEALTLCHLLLGAPEPPGLTASAQKRALRQCQWLTRGQYWTGATQTGSLSALHPSNLRQRLRQYTLRRTWRGAWNRLTADLSEPVDWDILPLPQRWEGLYPFLRPLGWFLRQILKR